MEPDLQRQIESAAAAPPASPELAQNPRNHPPSLPERNTFEWVFLGPNGLRAGWSILLFYVIYEFFGTVVATILYLAGIIGDSAGNSARGVLIAELIPLFALLGAASIISLLEGRRPWSYNLAGPQRAQRFAAGAAVGFVALSLLVAGLSLGGWLRIDHALPPGLQAFRDGALWGCAFLTVASVEEGLFRCYGLFTLARGINFWWALAAEIAACTEAFWRSTSNGILGVYIIAGIGLFPCLALHLKGAPRSAFWQAAWVTSTVFGLYHTSNNGENWIGVFAAAAIGFVFCMSVRLTGSAWWAIGCHAAWDWAETFFYGTADSGMQGHGHFLSAQPAGSQLWSGGTDGPEGSLLVLGVIVLLALFVLVAYGRRELPAPEAVPAEPTMS
ncbi:MAG: CPBP family intramembrane glutamic endopeptidase [Terracidiphilus sp.]|jgi:membrane protease YdiL (CAAX protease family)